MKKIFDIRVDWLDTKDTNLNVVFATRTSEGTQIVIPLPKNAPIPTPGTILTITSNPTKGVIEIIKDKRLDLAIFEWSPEYENFLNNAK